MGMASKQYYKNLNTSFENFVKAANVNSSYRKFDTAIEDPVSSLKAYHFRQEVSENNDFQSNVSYLMSKLKTQENSISSIQSVVNNTDSTDVLKAITGTTSGEDRATIATKIRKLQASLVSDANVQFGGNYLFGGAGISEAPFSVDGSGNLLYRGIDVNSGKIAAGTTVAINGVQITLGDTAGTYDGYSLKIVSGSPDGTSIDPGTKTIAVTLDLSTQRTNQDLLKTLKDEFPNISMTGDVDRPVISDAAQATTARIGDAQITLGDAAGTYNNYTIKVQDGSAPVNVDDTNHVITVSLKLNSDNTAQDVLNSLKKDNRFSSASITGNPSATVSAATTATLTASHLPSSVAANTIGLKGLEQLSNEGSLSDIGAGLSLDPNNQVNTQSVFNSAIPGISILGFGTKDGSGTGVSNNLYTLMGQIADQLESSSYSYDSIKPYIDQFTKQTDLVSAAITKAGTNYNYLETNQARLETIGDNSEDALDLAANVDTVDAYEDYLEKQYTYQASLKIGSQLLQTTVLDYMK
jgi:flagellin-like hook-associated protein FlgL